jgi:transcriptional regulator with XRE-family HTH domain
MTITDDADTAEHPARRQRPGSGIPIDPRLLTAWRNFRALNRQDLSDAIARLWLDGHPDAIPFVHEGTVPLKGGRVHRPKPWAPGYRICETCAGEVSGGLSKDAIAKIENGGRRPKARTLRALYAALGIAPPALMPGARFPDPDPELEQEPEIRPDQLRRQVHERNRAMRAFADALGRPELYRRPNGRISYTAELAELYDAYLADTDRQRLASLQLCTRSVSQSRLSCLPLTLRPWPGFPVASRLRSSSGSWPPHSSL